MFQRLFVMHMAHTHSPEWHSVAEQHSSAVYTITKYCRVTANLFHHCNSMQALPGALKKDSPTPTQVKGCKSKMYVMKFG